MANSRSTQLRRLKRSSRGGRVAHSGPPSPQSALVLDAVKDHTKGVTLGALMKELGLENHEGRSYLWRKLALLRKYGLVKKIAYGIYRVSNK